MTAVPASAARDHVLYVCTGCNFSKMAQERDGTRGGARLWAEILREAARRGGAAMHLEPVACLSVCKDSCAAALTAPAKYVYVFGWLDPAGAAADLLDCAALYTASPDGHIERAARPPATRRLIARVPPFGRDPDRDDDRGSLRMAVQMPKPHRPW